MYRQHWQNRFCMSAILLAYILCIWNRTAEGRSYFMILGRRCGVATWSNPIRQHGRSADRVFKAKPLRVAGYLSFCTSGARNTTEPCLPTRALATANCESSNANKNISESFDLSYFVAGKKTIRVNPEAKKNSNAQKNLSNCLGESLQRRWLKNGGNIAQEANGLGKKKCLDNGNFWLKKKVNWYGGNNHSYRS